MKAILALSGLAAILMAVLVWEWSADDAAAVPSRPATAASGPRKAPVPEFDADALTEVADTIAGRPLFSRDRRPGNRPAAAAGDGPGAATVPVLTGVIVGPGGGRAIFAEPGGRSRAVSAGEKIGGLTVRTIEPQGVTVSDSEGVKVLRPTYTPGNNPAPAAGTNGTANRKANERQRR